MCVWEREREGGRWSKNIIIIQDEVEYIPVHVHTHTDQHFNGLPSSKPHKIHRHPLHNIPL